MKVTGIIAEYNPFHKGHQWQIDRLRESGSSHLVAVMGGNFLQRGTPALCPKHQRAEMALNGGIDLVIELPLPYACAPAQRFAFGGVSLLGTMGCVDELAFGSECGDMAQLRQVVAAVDDPAVRRCQSRLLDDGFTFAKARQLAVAEVFSPPLATLLESPNNTLGIEYLRQVELLGLPLLSVTLPRQGADHGGDAPRDGIASASHLRRLIREGGSAAAAPYLPATSLEVLDQAITEGVAPAALYRLDRAILARLRSMSPADYAALPDLSEGLENRLREAARSATSVSDLLQRCKTKRYPLARLRRLTLAAFLGIDGTLCQLPPPYLRVLGMTDRGRELLGRMKYTATLPVSPSLARLAEQSPAAQRLAALESHSSDLYGLALPQVLPCGLDYTTPLVRSPAP